MGKDLVGDHLGTRREVREHRRPIDQGYGTHELRQRLRLDGWLQARPEVEVLRHHRQLAVPPGLRRRPERQRRQDRAEHRQDAPVEPGSRSTHPLSASLWLRVSARPGTGAPNRNRSRAPPAASRQACQGASRCSASSTAQRSSRTSVAHHGRIPPHMRPRKLLALQHLSHDGGRLARRNPTLSDGLLHGDGRGYRVSAPALIGAARRPRCGSTR